MGLNPAFAIRGTRSRSNVHTFSLVSTSAYRLYRRSRCRRRLLSIFVFATWHSWQSVARLASLLSPPFIKALR